MDTIWPDVLVEKSGPKYKRVADTIRLAIKGGTLKAGSKLPPVRSLAYQLSITPGTVARAYTILTDEGVLQAEVGRGTFVSEVKKPVLDDVWSRDFHLAELANPDHVSLFSPRLIDVGQVGLLREIMRKTSDMDSFSLLNYPTRDAYKPVREAALNWLSDVPLGPLREPEIVLTHGGQNAIMTVLQALLTEADPVVMVEDLSYAGFRRAAEMLRANVVGIAMDEHGIVPESLERVVRKTGSRILCTSPEVHNPTGTFTPLSRRKAILDIANRHGIQIVEDDCYRMGVARAPTYRALAPDLGWHVTSISKSLTPALRVGFAIAPKGKASDLRRAAEYSYFGLAQPLAEITRLLLSDPRSREMVKGVRSEMAKYVRVAVNTLGVYELRWDDQVPFLWLNLPSGWRAAAFTRAAEARGVQLRSADEFALRDGRAPNAVRIAINGHVTLDRFEGAMLALLSLLDNPPEQISV